MALVPYPVNPAHQRVELQPRAAVQSNRSVITRARQAVDLGYSWWEASVDIARMDLDEARAWRLFSGRVRGAGNEFRLPVLPAPQHDLNLTVRSVGASSDPYSLPSDGWPASSTILLGGDYVTVGDQLLLLDADVNASASGTATLQFHQPIRGVVADNTLIETRKPYLLSAFEDDAPALAISVDHLQDGFSFDVSEAF